jgi:hypothetical protein
LLVLPRPIEAASAFLFIPTLVEAPLSVICRPGRLLLDRTEELREEHR